MTHDNRDLFTAGHWNGLVAVTVYPAARGVGLPGPDDLAQRLFRRPVAAREWAALVGAPDEAVVEVITERWNGRMAVRISVAHHWFESAALRYVFSEHGEPVVRNEGLELRPQLQRRGIGTRILAHQVRAARRLGVSRLTLEAAGGPGSPYNGYYTWALLGFDGPIPSAVRQRLPETFAGATTVLDVLGRPGGAGWWRRNGREFSGVFDLAEGSRSVRVLAAYTAFEGIVI